MNLPNRLTVMRIILIPILIGIMVPLLPIEQWQNFSDSLTARWLALVVFCVASITDFLDGQIARRQNLVTNMGKFLDPIADKMLVISTFIVASTWGMVHPMVVVVILAREFAVTGLRTLAAEQGVVIAAGWLGKIKTVTQMFALIWLLAMPIIAGYVSGSTDWRSVSWLGPINYVLVGIAFIMTLWSGVDYFLRNRQFLQEH